MGGLRGPEDLEMEDSMHACCVYIARTGGGQTTM